MSDCKQKSDTRLFAGFDVQWWQPLICRQTFEKQCTQERSTRQGGCCVISVLFQHSRIKHIRLEQLSQTKVFSYVVRNLSHCTCDKEVSWKSAIKLSSLKSGSATSSISEGRHQRAWAVVSPNKTWTNHNAWAPKKELCQKGGKSGNSTTPVTCKFWDEMNRLTCQWTTLIDSSPSPPSTYFPVRDVFTAGGKVSVKRCTCRLCGLM